jgi:hypothetical protein
VLATRRCRGPGGTKPSYNVRIGQGIAAGVLANGTGALFVAAIGTGTTALMLKSSWLLHRLNHGRQLSAIAVYRYEFHAGTGTMAYFLMLIAFPAIGLVTSTVAAASATPAPRPSGPWTGGGGPPGPGPAPAPEPPPPGGRRADAEDRVPALS